MVWILKGESSRICTHLRSKLFFIPIRNITRQFKLWVLPSVCMCVRVSVESNMRQKLLVTIMLDKVYKSLPARDLSNNSLKLCWVLLSNKTNIFLPFWLQDLVWYRILVQTFKRITYPTLCHLSYLTYWLLTWVYYPIYFREYSYK